MNSNILQNPTAFMKLLKTVGIGFFFIHFYIVVFLALLKNMLTYLWKLLTQTHSTDKPHHISPFAATHPQVFAPTIHVVSHDGFDLDIHEFPTADGAEVSMWRVRKSDIPMNKPFPIIMMHGLLDCSVSWFLQTDKSKSLPYLLAEQGYDVWVGNNRGNRVSRNEEDNCPHYWEYNVDHLVEYDQPAVINGVLAQTGKEKVIYIGHSQGSTQFLLGMGLHSQLRERVAVFIGLGTVVSLQNTRNHTVLNALSRLYLLEFYRFLGFRKILVIPKAVSRAVGVLLYNSGFHSGIMLGFIRLLCGFSIRNKIPSELFGVIITHEPGGSSVNNALQWVQCYRQGGIMRRFNYGHKGNIQRYGSEHPPAYCLQHLGELPFKCHLFRGLKDAVMNETDFTQLAARFADGKIATYQLPDYNHLDYVWSDTAHYDLYGHILRIAEEASASTQA